MSRTGKKSPGFSRGEERQTCQHTLPQALAAQASNVGMLVGGPLDGGTEKRTIRPEQVAKVEALPW